ncbi:MAG TPA: ATP-binding protein [Dissulfurispiraceae bacterium]|nr:ATP-binding protein [Dissulfurispiraceae bacterium]
MKTSIFRRIFVLYAVIIIVTAIISETFLAKAIRSSYEENLTSSMVAQISLIADAVSFDRGGQDAFCRAIRDKNDARVTLVALDGTVLGDSDHDSSTMEKHGDRPEILRALHAGFGTTVRMSDTLNYEAVYVAKRIDRAGQTLGVIRMALPLKKADEVLYALRVQSVLLLAGILLITSLFSVWQANRLRQLLGQLSIFSNSLARGAFGRKMFMDKTVSGEFADISENLNTMSDRLQDSMAKSEEEKERLKVIFQSNPDAMIIIGPRGRIQMASESAQNLFGGRIVGQQYYEVIRSGELTGLVRKVSETRQVGELEISLQLPENRIFSVRISPLSYKAGELGGLVVVFHDMTKIRKLEQMRKDFVANVSHELRTPLTAIRGFSETLLDGALDDRQHALRFLTTIKNHAERLDTIVDDLMMLSRIEFGDIKVEKSDVSPAEAIDAAIMVLKEKAQQKGLFLKSEVAEADTLISADKNRLLQILLNLIDNAIKFTDKGGVTVSFRIADDTPEFSVHDTGIGIPKEHLDRVGERFYRVDAARSRELGGTGLGLAIVKHLVRAHGWELVIRSEPGKGTAVSVLLRDQATSRTS